MRVFTVGFLICLVLGVATCSLARSSEYSDQENPAYLERPERETSIQNKRVLILYTHRQMSPINAQWHAGIIESVRRDYPGPIDVDVEYMDVVLQSDRDYFSAWTSSLRLKYSKFPPDVIVPVFFPALTFVLTNRDMLFPEVPIVYCAVPRSFGASQSQRPNITGVGFDLNFEQSASVIQQVLPETSRLIVLSGNSTLDDWFRRAAILNMKQVSPNLEIVDLAGLGPSQASAILSKAQPNTAAMLLTFEIDNQNNRYSTSEYLQEIKGSSKIPIFGCYDTVLGKGILGGALVSPTEQGQIAGRLVARILNGESADAIPDILDKSYSHVFDAEVMQEFGISEKRLPPGSKIVNRKPTLWNQYGRYIATGLTALAIQSAIIVSLLINRRKRIAAETEARSLAGRILSAGEDERRYLARELHDDVSQRLAAVSIETGAMENKMQDSSEAKMSLGKLKKTLKGICDDLHRMSRHMHPSVLDDFGLPEALQSECHELSQRWGIPIVLHSTKEFPEIPKPTALCLYRIAQESLWNAIRHSGASKIDIKLRSDAECVYLDICDDGKGFDPNLNRSKRGLGLASMTERVRLAGGIIKIQSAPEFGVSIAVIVPTPDSPTPYLIP